MMSEPDQRAEDEAEITWPYTFKFRQPRTVLDTEYDSITLREPTTEDFLESGLFDGATDSAAVVAMIAKLSRLPEPTVKRFPGIEMLRLRNKLLSFFVQAAS